MRRARRRHREVKLYPLPAAFARANQHAGFRQVRYRLVYQPEAFMAGSTQRAVKSTLGRHRAAQSLRHHRDTGGRGLTRRSLATILRVSTIVWRGDRGRSSAGRRSRRIWSDSRPPWVALA